MMYRSMRSVILFAWLAVMVVGPACNEQDSGCENEQLIPWPADGSGSGHQLTSIQSLTERTPIPTPQSTVPLSTPRTTDVLPSDQTPFFTSNIVLIVAVACASALLLGSLVAIFLLLVCKKRVKKCSRTCGCPCSRRAARLEGPLITVTFRSSYHGDRESYYIRTDEIGPTTFYTHSRENNDDIEFSTTNFFTQGEVEEEEEEEGGDFVPQGLVGGRRSVTFERSVGGSAAVDPESPLLTQHRAEVKDSLKEEEPKSDVDDEEIHIQELDNLEKVLDNALVKFETTAL